jgi:hypothetical protein
MAPTREELIAEIVANARRDRKRLEAVADGLANGFKKPIAGDDAESDDFDSDVAAAFAEEIAKVGDSLTRVNQQLVELVKSEKKNVDVDDGKPKKLKPADVEDVYDNIQPEEESLN